MERSTSKNVTLNGNKSRYRRNVRLNHDALGKRTYLDIEQMKENCHLPDWDYTLHHRQDDKVPREGHDEAVGGGNRGRCSPPPIRNHTLRHLPQRRSRRWHFGALRNHRFSISVRST